MPLSTSSSDSHTAPQPERAVPSGALGTAAVAAIVVFAVALGAWEWRWRAFGAEPAYQNSSGLWAKQRRRIDHGEGDKLVVIGSSRILFNLQLDVWERLSGERPIQLALEGTSPLFAMEDLAEDPDFRGRLLVGVSPNLLFSGYRYRATVYKDYLTETPSQRAGQWLSMHLLEPFFAFYDPDFSLMTLLKRQSWPARPGVRDPRDVRKLSIMVAPDRHTRLWRKVEVDPAYRAIARGIWAQNFGQLPPGFSGPEALRPIIEAEMAKTVAAVRKLRAKGVKVIFVRSPSSGPFLENEEWAFPRRLTWDPLLERTGVPGIHFEDHPDLQGMELPEWSHLTYADSIRFTEAVYRHVQRSWGAD